MRYSVVIVMLMVLTPATCLAQFPGPSIDRVHIEVFPINSAPAGILLTTDYSIRLIQTGKLQITTQGFLDLEPVGEKKFYFTNHGQILRYGRIPVGMMFEEGLGRRGFFARAGPTTNFNDLPGVRIVTRAFAKVLNVAWLRAAAGDIQDEVKVSMATKDFPIGIGFLNAEGFYRIRYGSRPNTGQPQIVFRPSAPKWLKLVCEIEPNGPNVDFYVGARVTLIKK